MKEEKKFTALTEILARQLLNPSAGVLVSSLKWLIDLKYELSQTESEQPIMKFQMSHRKSKFHQKLHQSKLTEMSVVISTTEHILKANKRKVVIKSSKIFAILITTQH